MNFFLDSQGDEVALVVHVEEHRYICTFPKTKGGVAFCLAEIQKWLLSPGPLGYRDAETLMDNVAEFGRCRVA